MFYSNSMILDANADFVLTMGRSAMCSGNGNIPILTAVLHSIGYQIFQTAAKSVQIAPNAWQFRLDILYQRAFALLHELCGGNLDSLNDFRNLEDAHIVMCLATANGRVEQYPVNMRHKLACLAHHKRTIAFQF